MAKNIFSRAWQLMKKTIDYTPPANTGAFVLDENRPFDKVEPSVGIKSEEDKTSSQISDMLNYAHRLAGYAEKLNQAMKAGSLLDGKHDFRQELEALERQWRELDPLRYSYQQNRPLIEASLSTSLTTNRKTLEDIYRFPRNRDLVLREISIAGKTPAPALIAYLDGLVNGQKLDQFILSPLMSPAWHTSRQENNSVSEIMKKVIPNGQVRQATSFNSLQEGINDGDTALIVDGLNEAIIIETKGWEHRSVDTPKTEQTIRGSLAAFSENLRVNTGLIRSILRTSDLVTEMIKIGKRGNLNCALMYIDSIANHALVEEVRRRLNGIETDYIIDSGNLVQFIDDHPRNLFPQTLSTERPDRVAASLTEGRLALVLEGNPFVQILPVSFFSFFHSAEDFSLKTGIANFMRTLRLFGALISTILPSLYLSLSYFHSEAMPTELILAVAASRENVPFPAWFEIFMMEVSFELIREAGVRIPGVLGSTIGIVGAIILGQAAVTAKLVSPIIVVIIAITGLSSFTIPEIRMASAVRIIRFVLLVVSAVSGLVGLGMTLIILVAVLCNMKSYGMPYLVPVGPRTIANVDVVLRGQVYNQELRPDALGTEDRRRQPTISRTWREKLPREGDGSE